MEFETFNFRNALAILDQRPEWAELRKVIGAISRTDIIDSQQKLAASLPNAPAGAQQAVNRVFEEYLPAPPWIHQCLLFEETKPSTKQALAKWTMDFVKRGHAAPGSPDPDFGLGVEVTFNHSEAIPWTLIRLDLASEAGVRIRDDARIDVGVAIYASRAFKAWGRMDGAVGTFEQACLWLGMMRPVLPIPLVLVGLKPRDAGASSDWEKTEAFRGTARRSRSANP